MSRESTKRLVNNKMKYHFCQAFFHFFSGKTFGVSPGAYNVIGASTIYEMVVSNGFYNWLMWGYSIKDNTILCEDRLASSFQVCKIGVVAHKCEKMM